MILGYNEILRRINQESMLSNVNFDNINAASVDLTLAPDGLKEDEGMFQSVVDVSNKGSIPTVPVIFDKGYDLPPGHMIICATNEIFNLPSDVAAEFRLKSSASRNGLNLCLGLHCDPGWHGSVLSFTLINQTRRTTLRLTAGMKIGQAIFRLVQGEVPEEQSYAAKGQYNNDQQVTGSKGIR